MTIQHEAASDARRRSKTSLSLSADTLASARTLGLNVSAIADAALAQAVREAQRRQWLDENADAFARQRAWHAEHGHPAADIMAGSGAETWR